MPESFLFYPTITDPQRLTDQTSRAMVSIMRLERAGWDYSRRPIGVTHLLIDSGGYGEITRHGAYRLSVRQYARRIRWLTNGATLWAAAAQDYPLTPAALDATGLTAAEHTRRSLDRWQRLARSYCGTWVMPVLHGRTPSEYADQAAMYAAALDRLPFYNPAPAVGVGGLVGQCLDLTAEALRAIAHAAPHFNLHGFGLGLRAIKQPRIRHRLASSDSASWSLGAYYAGRDQNDPAEAERYRRRCQAHTQQLHLAL